MRNYPEYCIKTSSNTCFGYFKEAILTNIQNIMSSEEIRTKQGLSYISFCLLRILYNSKFILMATSFGTNAVVVTRVHSTICEPCGIYPDNQMDSFQF